MLRPGINSGGVMAARKPGGFTLIEVMIAMLMLSVGLMAMSGLQASSMRQTHMAYMRTQAAIAASEMAERMRANVVGVQNNQYASVTALPSPVPTACDGAYECSATEIAARDAYEWLDSLANNRDLVSAQGRVICLDSPCDIGSLHTITVMWDASRNGASGTTCDPNVATDLVCYTITVRP